MTSAPMKLVCATTLFYHSVACLAEQPVIALAIRTWINEKEITLNSMMRKSYHICAELYFIDNVMLYITIVFFWHPCAAGNETDVVLNKPL